MEIFKIKLEDEGKVFVIRPLIDMKNPNTSIVSYEIAGSGVGFSGRPLIRYMCYALIDGELKIFWFGEHIKKIISDGRSIMLRYTSSSAIKITVGVKYIPGSVQKFIDNDCVVITDDAYRFDNTDEKKNYLINLFNNADMSLESALSIMKNSFSDYEIQKKLKDILA